MKLRIPDAVSRSISVTGRTSEPEKPELRRTREQNPESPVPIWVFDESGGPVDLRFVELREQVVASRRQRALFLVGTLGTLAFLLAAVGGYLLSPLADVDAVNVIGEAALSPQEIQTASGIQLGSPLIAVNEIEVERRLDALYSIEHASVLRRWDGVVEIRITERVPALVLSSGKHRLSVTADGVVVSDQPEDLLLREVRVASLESNGTIPKPGTRVRPSLVSLVGFASALPYDLAVRVTAITIDANDELILDVEGGVTVIVGRGNDVRDKLSAFRTMLGPQIDRSEGCLIDLRIPMSSVMRRKPYCDPPAPVEPPAPADLPSDELPATAPATATAEVPATATAPATGTAEVPVPGDSPTTADEAESAGPDAGADPAAGATPNSAPPAG